jgi:hypothetical protein
MSVTRTLKDVPVPLRPSGIFSGIARVLVAALTVAPASAAAERSRIVIVAVPRAAVTDGLVVIPIAVVEAGAAGCVRRHVVVIA